MDQSSLKSSTSREVIIEDFKRVMLTYIEYVLLVHKKDGTYVSIRLRYCIAKLNINTIIDDRAFRCLHVQRAINWMDARHLLAEVD